MNIPPPSVDGPRPPSGVYVEPPEPRFRRTDVAIWTLAGLGALSLLLWLGPFVAAFVRTHHQWHQALTVTVETPEGERAGTAVAQVEAWFGKQPLSANEVEYRLQGEATAVEVAPGRWLFALLPGSEERYACAAGGALGWAGPWSRGSSVPPGERIERGEWLAEVPQQVGQPPAPVPEECRPLFVTFDDPADPASVRRVDPGDLAASFGPGVSLTAVTLAITEEAVTDGRVEAVLPWLESIGRERASVVPKPDVLVSDLPDPTLYLIAPSDFSTELYR